MGFADWKLLLWYAFSSCFLLVEGDVVRASLFFDIRCMPLHTSQVVLDGNGAGSVFRVQVLGVLLLGI